MFGNFLYFIIALLILSLYHPVDDPPLSFLQALAAFAALAALFALYTRLQFMRLAARARRESRPILDQQFSLLVTRIGILSLVLFTLNVWGLDLPSYLKRFDWLADFPTLSELFFLLIFIAYLTIGWSFAYTAHRAIYGSDISRGAYVYSNLAFSIPVLIPYALLSGLMDILLFLPFDQPKQILSTTIGQTSYFLIFLVIAAIFAPLLVKQFWRCRPLPPGDVRQRIEALCRRAGVSYADIVYWPIFGGRMITAGVMGLVGRYRYILVTEALLQLLRPEEIDQVMAHEIGHVKRKHLLLYLFFFIGFMLISYVLSSISYYLVFLTTPVLKLILMFEWNHSDVYTAVSSVLLVVGVIVYFRYIFGYFMRNFERQADGFVFELFGSAQPLIDTFGKIALSSGQAADKPNWHHFSIQQRIDHLRQCEFSRDHITRHDRKVRRSIVAYLTGLVIVALAVFQLNQFVQSQSNGDMALNALEAYLDQKQTGSAQDALLYLMVGNLHVERNHTTRAAAAYEHGLALNPNHPDLLNNLAWLLATSSDLALRNPTRALTLAQQALALKKAPHIWDTMAEALFANHRIQEAIAAEQQALAMDPRERPLYEAQLSKFQKASNQKK